MADTSSVVDIFGDGKGVALFEFSNNNNDTSGNYTGASIDSQATYGTGDFGSSRIFNSSNRYANTSYVWPALTGRAFSTRVKLGTGLGTGTIGLGGDGANNGGNSNFVLFIAGSTGLLTGFVGGALTSGYDVSSLMGDGNFHLFTISVDENEFVSISVDGVEVIAETSSGTAISGVAGTYNVTISGIGEGSLTQRLLDAEVDEFRIFEGPITTQAQRDTLLYNDDSYLTPANSVPTAITDFAASDDQLGQVTVTFTNATGTPTPTYNLFEDNVQVATGISSGYVHTVTAGTYTYRVDAVNSEGTTASNNDSGTSTAPVAPTAIADLTANIGDTLVDLSWSAPNDGGSAITGYVVEYKLTSEPTTWTDAGHTGTGTTLQITGLTNDSSYDFRVYAVNAIGTSTVSNIPSVTPSSGASAPDAITGLSAVTGDTQVTLSWPTPNDNGAAITNYNIYQDSVDIGDFANSPQTITGLTNDTQYSFEVRAVNSEGEANASNIVNVTPSAVVVPVTSGFLSLNNTTGQEQTVIGLTFQNGTSLSSITIFPLAVPTGNNVDVIEISVNDIGQSGNYSETVQINFSNSQYDINQVVNITEV